MMKAFKKPVKLSSKGQITLPKAVRDDLKAKQVDLLVIYKLDDHRYAIEKRTPFEVLTEEIAREAEAQRLYGRRFAQNCRSSAGGALAGVSLQVSEGKGCIYTGLCP